MCSCLQQLASAREASADGQADAKSEAPLFSVLSRSAILDTGLITEEVCLELQCDECLC